MAKFFGAIGYASTAEKAPGVYEETMVERKYYGDVIKLNRRLENGEGLIDDITVNNAISIIADPYANQNLFAIRYAEWMGTKWKVTNVEVVSPRLILTLGGVFNGPTGWTTRGAV